jgi:hypothetical protein
MSDRSPEIPRKEPESTQVSTCELEQQLAECTRRRRSALAAWHSAESDAKNSAFLALESDELVRWRLERRYLGLQSDEYQPVRSVQRNRLGGRLSAILLSRVRIDFHGCRLSVAVGLLNPFRLAGLPETVLATPLLEAVQKNRQLVNSGDRKRFPIGVGLETIVSSRSVNRRFQLNDWRTPAGRLVAELFWLHVPEKLFKRICEFGDLTDERAVRLLLAELPGAGEQASLFRHALAVCWLYIAVSREATFAAGQIGNAVGYWDVALDRWVVLQDDSSFWQYVQKRHGKSLTAEARQWLPVLLSGLVGRLAVAYGQQGDDVSCHRMLSMLRRSRLADEVRQDVPVATVRGSYY